MMTRPFIGIPADKWVASLAIALSAMCLLCGYEFMRSAAQSLFIGAYTAKNLPVVMMMGPVGRC